MTCLTRTVVGLATLATLAVGPIFAQYTPGRYVSPYARPPVSPYINLLRPGSNPAVNYYGLVRPQINMYNSLRNLQQQQQAGTAPENASEPGGPQEVFTGHRAQFMTQGRYFLNNSGPGAGGLSRGGSGGVGTAGGIAGRTGSAGTGAGLGGASAAYRGTALRR